MSSARQARRQGLVIGVATGAYAISFGALSTTAGLDVWQTMVLSALMFTGGSQFAFVGVVGAGGALASASAAAVLLGTRNLLYGVSLAEALRYKGLRRLGAAQLTIDESTANSLTQPDEESVHAGFWSAGLWVFAFWNAFTLVGALAGHSLGDPRRFGLDAVAAAAFLALLWPRLRSGGAVALAVGCAFLALVLTPFVPAGVPILSAAAVAAVAGGRERVTP